MSKPKTPPPHDENTLMLERETGKSDKRLLAEKAMAPDIGNAITARRFARGGAGVFDVTETVAIVRQKVKAVQSGDLSDLEAMLAAQAIALDSIFNEMARRAALNMGEYMQATEVYMRIALKAQSQCRTTLQTLAEIKNPRPVAFVKQANIAHGPQQVNNAGNDFGTSTRARAENSGTEPNKLLEHSTHGEWLDAGTAGKASGTDPLLATVEAIHRAED